MSEVACLPALREATELVGDPIRLRAAFDEDGYVLLRGLLDRERVLDVRRQICQVLADVGWLEPGSDSIEARPGPVVHRHDWQDLEWYDGYTGIQRLEDFHALAHDPALTTVASALVNTDELVVHGQKIVRITFPGADFPTPPHQDYWYVGGSPRAVTAWVPFGDYSREYGGLCILPGSHRDGLREHGKLHGAGGHGVHVDPAEVTLSTTDYRMGDVLLFDALVLHHGPNNRADRLRMSADYRYQSADESILQACLEPSDRWFKDGEVVPGWDELTEGWTSTQWGAPRDGLTIVPHFRT